MDPNGTSISKESTAANAEGRPGATLPLEAAPFLGIAVAQACFQKSGGIAWFLRRYTDEDLRDMARHLARVEFDTVWARDCMALEAGGHIPIGPSWWVTDVLPAIKGELERRHRPKQTYSGNSPIARLKQLDLATVVGQYTELRPAGPGKLKGRCPLHEERTPSFYVYEDTQKWHCFGACATGGDIVDLVTAVRRRAA